MIDDAFILTRIGQWEDQMMNAKTNGEEAHEG